MEILICSLNDKQRLNNFKEQFDKLINNESGDTISKYELLDLF